MKILRQTSTALVFCIVRYTLQYTYIPLRLQPFFNTFMPASDRTNTYTIHSILGRVFYLKAGIGICSFALSLFTLSLLLFFTKRAMGVNLSWRYLNKEWIAPISLFKKAREQRAKEQRAKEQRAKERRAKERRAKERRAKKRFTLCKSEHWSKNFKFILLSF